MDTKGCTFPTRLVIALNSWRRIPMTTERYSPGRELMWQWLGKALRRVRADHPWLNAL